MKIKRIRPSIYGILCERGRVLVTETRGVKNNTFVNFPGGGIKRGEAPAQALEREFAEETGLVVRAEEVLHASMEFHPSHVRPDRQLLGIYWRVTRVGGALFTGDNGDDIVSVFWAKIGALEALPFTSFDREALPRIVAQLGTVARAF